MFKVTYSSMNCKDFVIICSVIACQEVAELGPAPKWKNAGGIASTEYYVNARERVNLFSRPESNITYVRPSSECR